MRRFLMWVILALHALAGAAAASEPSAESPGPFPAMRGVLGAAQSPDDEVGEALDGLQPRPRTAQELRELGEAYMAREAYARAAPIYARLLALEEERFGKNHPALVQTLSRLGRAYRLQGLPVKAQPYYERALSIGEAVLGKDHPDVAGLLSNVARIYQDQGLYARAEPLYQRSVLLVEAARGKASPELAGMLNNHANLYGAQGLYAQAEPLYLRVLAMGEKGLGKEHPTVLQAVDNLAGIYEKQGLYSRAEPLCQRLLAAWEAKQGPEDASVRRLALSAVLLRKGRSVGELASTSRAIHQSLSAGEQDTFERLRGLRSQLSMLSLRGLASPTPASAQHLKQLQAQADALEAELARSSAPLRALTSLPGPGEIVDRVAQALPRDGALVELVLDTYMLTLPKTGTREMRVFFKHRYLALVLFPDGQTRAVDLGDSVRIGRAATRLRDALAQRDARFQAPAQALSQLVFQPLLPVLGETRRLFLSPDGELSLVPFAALHDGRRFLVDSFDISYLTSGRELLPRAEPPVPASSVVVLADPDFNAPLQAASPEDTAEQGSLVARFLSTHRAGLAKSSWTPLPGTRREARAIQRLVPQAELFLGAEATKERLLGLPTPGVLHLATHGFFLEDAPASGSTRAAAQFSALGENASPRLPVDALLRSGLVFAGADPARLESALVTASEMAGLNLWGTQLVVLSACDTGRGEVRRGHGVYGLRRALAAAGAETVVMSLWRVSDGSTSELMALYYQHLLEGRGRAAALRDAMRELRRIHPHPHYWAPFIVLGRDTPLSGLARPAQR